MGMVIGVDIGSRQIKLAGVEKKKEAEVKWVDSFLTPEHAVSDGELINSEAIMYALSDYSAKYKLKKIPMALCMNSAQIGTLRFDMHKVTSNVLYKGIQLEFVNQLGLSLEEYALAYKLHEKSRQATKGVIAYCPHKIIQDYRDLFKWSDLKLKFVDVNANCMTKFYNQMVVKQDPKETVMMIDIGTDTSHITIVKERKLIMSRSVINGGNDLDAVIATYLGIELQAANQLKHEKFRSIYEEGKSLDAQINSAYQGILREVEYTIGKFQEEHQCEVSKLVLLGGGSNLPGLASQMKQDFNKPTQLLMGSEVKNGFVTDVHLFANAIGAAIRED